MLMISPVIVLNVNNSGSVGFSSIKRDYHVHLECVKIYVLSTTLYVLYMCMSCYDYSPILDGVVDSVLTPVVSSLPGAM